MSGKDPFSFDDNEDVERTVIRPAPTRVAASYDEGERTVIGRPPGFGAGSSAQDEGERTTISVPTGTDGATGAFAPRRSLAGALPLVGSNPLLAAGSRLIALAHFLRAATDHQNTENLRQQIVEELRAFQSGARARDAKDDEVRYGHYALCALLDEVILSTPWGPRTGWGSQTLVATFHNEVVSGDRMFEIAEALETHPNRSPNLLELIYYCVSFGFEGRLRLDRQGANRLFQMRERIYNALVKLRGPFERQLSPHWRGEDALYQPIARQAPLWVYLAAFAAAALLIYAGFLFALAAAGAAAVRPLTSLYAAGPARLNRTAPAPPSDTRLYQTVLGILKPDIDGGRVGVTDQPDAVLVRLKDKGLFASGSADLDASYDDTMKRVTQAIALTTGDVPVTGHTDSQPVRSLKFASNQALSEARAQTVVGKLVADGADANRLKPSGLGETQPVADNADETGRRQNRRVEVAIPKTYGTPQPVVQDAPPPAQPS
jgi:type VI secretion system protein ImpK